MNSGTSVELEAADVLARHFRAHPYDVHASAPELAARLRVPLELVRSVQLSLRRGGAANSNSLAHEGTNRMRVAMTSFRSALRRATDRPVRFAVITLLAGIVSVAVFSWVVPTLLPQTWHARVAPALNLVVFGTIVLLVFLHYLSCWRQARIRWALLTGLVTWLMVTSVSMVNLWWIERHDDAAAVLLSMFIVMLQWLLVSLLHTCVCCLSSVIGGYVRLRREDESEWQLSRQEMIDRLLSVRELLQTSGERAPEEPSALRQPWILRVRRLMPLYSILFGFVFGLILLASQLWALGGASTFEEGKPERMLIFTVVAFAGSVLASASIGFLSGRLRWAIVNVLLFHAAETLAYFIDFTPQVAYLRGIGLEAQSLIITAALATLFGSAGAVGAKLEDRAARKWALLHNDPNALMAEMVRLQYLLGPSARSVCVMVVDAAKSSMMKQGADPLVAEWTFREYQHFLERIVQRHGGSVHSTAGDGAVFEFDDSREAFQSAREIQTRIDDFNRDVNRLGHPFRLRIGLHQGEVAGDLSQVQYAAVIDIAAHVEAEAPVGGIALTAPVAEQLVDERIAELKETVDGHQVFVSLQPTLLE